MSLPLIANYHTHTYRCGHASPASEREYVEKAISSGIKILGFSDHTPYPGTENFPGRPGIRLDISELDGYCRTVLDLRDEYRDDIEIHLGLEVEYYPALFSGLMDQLRSRPIEYMLLGQHFTNNQNDGVHCGFPGEGILPKYTEQLICGLDTGMFTYVAHPDIVNHECDPEEYEMCMRRICRKANEFSLPLEINMLGLGTGRPYPYRRFWEIAASEGCKAIIGCDAHKPEDVFHQELIDSARALVSELGIELLDTVPLKNPFSK